MAGPSQYTLERMMESERAVIERDMAESSVDEFGAASGAKADWQPLATVPCKFYRRRESGRGPAKEVASVQRAVWISDGGALLPAGTDITDEDRLAEIQDPDGNVLHAGPFVVQAVFEHPTHTEIAWLNP